MRTFVIFIASLVILEDTIKPIESRIASRKPEDLKNCAVKPMDIAFIIDASPSIPQHDFKKRIKFLQGLVSLFQISPKKVRIAALSYGGDVIADTAFGFNKSEGKKNILHALSQIEWRPQRDAHANTGGAIAFARERFFSNHRPFAKQIGVLLTSSKLDYFERAKAEVDRLKLRFVKMIAIGVGDEVPINELEMISSSPDLKFHVNSFNDLKKIRLAVGRKICKGCTSQQIDFNFVFDLAQMGPNHQKIQEIIRNILFSNNFNSNQIRIGLVTEQYQEARVFHLNNYTYPQTLLAHFKMYEDNFLSSLLTQIRKKAFSPQNGGRENALRVAVLFVTGKIVDEKATVAEARLVKDKKIQIFVVDMGGKNRMGVLEFIASGGKSRIIDATGSKNTNETAAEVIYQVCNRRD